MVELNKFEQQFLKFLSNEITTQYFESWVYDHENIILSEYSIDFFYELISINYSHTECKHKLSKLLSIDFEKLEYFEMQNSLLNLMNFSNINNFSISSSISYDEPWMWLIIEIGSVKFNISYPFDISLNKSNDLTEQDLKNKFGDPKLFVNSILNSLQTSDFRLFNHKKYEQTDSMTITKMMRASENEYLLYINYHMCFIKKQYINSKMKNAWL